MLTEMNQVCKNKETGEIFRCRNHDCPCAGTNNNSHGFYYTEPFVCTPLAECEEKIFFRAKKEAWDKLQKTCRKARLAGIDRVYRFSNYGILLSDARPYMKKGTAEIPEPFTNFDYTAFDRCNVERLIISPSFSGVLIEDIEIEGGIPELVLSEGVKGLNMRGFTGWYNAKKVYLPRSLINFSPENYEYGGEYKCTFYVYKDSEAEYFVKFEGYDYKLIDGDVF